jgi:hypothetical protein
MCCNRTYKHEKGCEKKKSINEKKTQEKHKTQLVIFSPTQVKEGID